MILQLSGMQLSVCVPSTSDPAAARVEYAVNIGGSFFLRISKCGASCLNLKPAYPHSTPLPRGGPEGLVAISFVNEHGALFPASAEPFT
jgi:hypothetical protein